MWRGMLPPPPVGNRDGRLIILRTFWFFIVRISLNLLNILMINSLGGIFLCVFHLIFCYLGKENHYKLIRSLNVLPTWDQQIL